MSEPEPGFEPDPFSPAGTVERSGELARGIVRRRWGKVAVWLAVTFIILAPVASFLLILLTHH
jgi:hypothetical protein